MRQKFRRMLKDIWVYIGFDKTFDKLWLQVCVDLIKKVISDCWRGFEVMTKVDQGLTNVNRFDSVASVISVNDAN
jgi:hypothetical protein